MSNANYVHTEPLYVLCRGCRSWDTTGYEEDNYDKEPDLKFGWCKYFQTDMQAADFCTKGRHPDTEVKLVYPDKCQACGEPGIYHAIELALNCKKCGRTSYK